MEDKMQSYNEKGLKRERTNMGRDYTNTQKFYKTGTAQSAQEMTVGRKNDGPITASSHLLPSRPVPPTLLFGMET